MASNDNEVDRARKARREAMLCFDRIINRLRKHLDEWEKHVANHARLLGKAIATPIGQRAHIALAIRIRGNAYRIR